MLRPLIALAALAAPLLAAAPAAAVVLGTWTHDYGTNGGYTPENFDQTFADSVRLINGNQSPSDINFDSFDLSSLSGATIQEITFTITFDGADTASGGELWYIDIYGSVTGSYNDNVWTTLADDPGLDTLTFTLDAGTDTGGVDAFSHIVSTLELSFGFEETTSPNDWLNIYEATVTVIGEANVPLPAPVLLLLSGLAGLALWRRRGPAAA